MTRIISITIAGTLLLAAASARASEISYSGQIQALVAARCSACHGREAAPEYYAFKKEKTKWLAKGQGMKMDTYSHLIFFTAWPDTGALMRRLDDGKGAKDGKPGNMYTHLGVDEDERQKNLALFKEWVGNWTLKRWSEITKEEMNSITVRY